MDYITFKGKKWPVRISYMALKRYQMETGKSIETLEEDLTNFEILLHFALQAGCKAMDKECPFERKDMEEILDESLQEFTQIMIKGNSSEGNTEGAGKKK